jgi:hypothetical protein
VFVAFLLTSLTGAYAFVAAIKTAGGRRPVVTVIAGLLVAAALVGAR